MGVVGAGDGYPSPEKGAPPGDLLVHSSAASGTRASSATAPILWRAETLDVSDAALGTTL